MGITHYIANNINIFIPIIFSAVFGIMGFVIGKVNAWENGRRQFTKERFEKLYNPYVALRDKIHQGRAYNFYDLCMEDREKILTLLIENQVYAGSLLRTKIVGFIQCNVCIEESCNDISEKEFNERDKLYNFITDLIYDEWNHLQNKLYWTRTERIVNYIKGMYSEYKYEKIYMRNNEINAESKSDTN